MGRMLTRAGLRGVALLILWLTALLALSAPPAAAHAFLDSSDPAANAVVPNPPQTVSLHFTEPLETSYSRADLVDQNGQPVPGAASAIAPGDANTMVVTLPAGLGHGTYALLWRTLSTADGHTAQGYLPFTIGTQTDVRSIAGAAEETVSTLLPDWVSAVARWMALLGLAAVVGIWPIWLIVVRPAIAPTWQLGPAVTRRVRGYAVGAFVFALVANLIALIVQAITIAGTANLLGGLATTVGSTRYGTWWLVRIGLLLLFGAVLLGAAWWWPWRARPATFVALAMAAALPIPFSMVSHAGAEPVGRSTAIAFDYVHLLGASLWTGGLLTLIVALAPMVGKLTAAGRRVVLSRAIPRFSLLALIAWIVMGVTGIYSAWLQVGNLPALTETPYGQTLILKLILIVPLLILGGFNLAIVTRKLRAARTEERVEGWGNHFVTAVIAEAVIVTLLFGVVGMLVGTPPARQVLAQQAGSLRIPLDADGQSGTLIITPGIVGQNQYRLEFGSGHEAHLRNPSITDASLRFELPARKTGQIDVPLTLGASGAYEGQGAELAFPGDWHIQVTVRLPGLPDWVVPVTQTISTAAPPSELPPPPPLFRAEGIAALALLVLGVAGLVFALMGGSPTFRKEAAGLGAVAIVIALVLLVQARVPAQAAPAVDPNTGSASLDPGAVTRGATLFTQNCALCHGAGGRGDGPQASKLLVPPADLTTGHAIPHSDDDYRYWITNGIEGTGMPAFRGKLEEGQVQDVIAYVRSLQQSALQARDAPGPEACTVPPRTLDEIAALARQPAPAAPPNASETGGVPVDKTTQAAIEATARELVACSNAGDILRRLALYSDNRLRYAYPDGPTAALKSVAQTPLPVPVAQRVALDGVADVRQLPDGRVMAKVTVDDPANHSHSPTGAAQAQQQVARLIFVQEAGRWRVDETGREETQTDATSIANPAGS
jgi:copper transport protein